MAGRNSPQVIGIEPAGAARTSTLWPMPMASANATLSAWAGWKPARRRAPAITQPPTAICARPANAPAAHISIRGRRQSTGECAGAGIGCGTANPDREAAAAPAVAPAWKVMLGTNADRAPLAGMRRAGKTSESSGKANTEAAAAVHTRCRSAAGRFRRNRATSQAIANTAELLTATPTRNENAVIYLPSRFACSIIVAMRSSSSRVSRAADTSSRAATICSGEPEKNVSITCFTADRLALFRATTGR